MSNLIPTVDETHPKGQDITESYILRLPPKGAVALIVSCPHAGIFLPDGLEERLQVSPQDILNRGDRYTDWLTHEAPDFRAPQLICTSAPSFINIGRSTTSIYPADVEGGPGSLVCNPNDIYCGQGQGQGLVAVRTLFRNEAIYKHGQRPNAQEIQDRITRYYEPFHRRHEQLVTEALERHGRALIFDVHSAPSIGAPKDRDPGEKRADLIISNADGKSCDTELIRRLAELAQKHKLSCTINHPYSGGFITQKFGAHSADWGKRGCQSLQIEFNRDTMGVDEETLELVDPQRFMRMQNFASDAMEIMAYYSLGDF